jgi:glycosyltransferase involved in cell wall biosynthesis
VTAKPFLSVVMPIHNGADWIAATLDSMCLEPVAGLEIIAIDSSPTKVTSEIISGYLHRLPIRLLERKDIGSWQMKTNLGVELAAAKHVCMLHQDDLWLSGRMDAVRKWVAGAPDAVLHLAPSYFIDRHGRRTGRWTCPLPAEVVLDGNFFLERLLVQNFVSVPAPIFQRSAWLDCGGMDRDLWYTADWDIWAKLAEQGPVIYHDQATTAFRVHGSSQTVSGSRDARDFRSQMEVVLMRHLDRIPPAVRSQVETAARASIDINVWLAAASNGNLDGLMVALRHFLSLGPVGMKRYLRDSRLQERVVSRVRAKVAGAF